MTTELLELKKEDKNDYQPYLDILPSSFDEFPHMYTDDELEWLKGSEILKAIEENKKMQREDYDIICNLVEEYKQFNYKDYLDVATTINSRVFSIKINEVEHRALVPYADMLNHKVPKMTHWFYSDEKKGFVM
jgi:histone-lysine N-methyltransferase SETD3